MTEQIDEVEEIEISVPWGKVAGKWWGSKDIRPILCLHGWQDNAGTFDTLIPVLTKNVSYLAIDLPGHGSSSRLPAGMVYNLLQYTSLLYRIQNEYKWDKMSLLGHSMGAAIIFNYASLFPENVDLIILLDNAIPFSFPPSVISDSMKHSLNSYFSNIKLNEIITEPPSYTYDELIERLHKGSHHSVDTDKCHYLLRRGIKRSTKQPDMYYFTRDNRLRNHVQQTNNNKDMIILMARKIHCPYMFIEATKLPMKYMQSLTEEILTYFKQNKTNFVMHKLEGSTHHAHLNEPTKICNFINDFIFKYRVIEDVQCKL